MWDKNVFLKKGPMGILMKRNAVLDDFGEKTACSKGQNKSPAEGKR